MEILTLTDGGHRWQSVPIGSPELLSILISAPLELFHVPSCTYSTFAEATFALIFDQILPSGS